MSFLDILLGRPLASDEAPDAVLGRQERGADSSPRQARGRNDTLKETAWPTPSMKVLPQSKSPSCAQGTSNGNGGGFTAPVWPRPHCWPEHAAGPGSGTTARLQTPFCPRPRPTEPQF